MNLKGVVVGEGQHMLVVESEVAVREALLRARAGEGFRVNNPAVNALQQSLGITHKRTVAQLIALNTNVPAAELPANVFFAP